MCLFRDDLFHPVSSKQLHTMLPERMYQMSSETQETSNLTRDMTVAEFSSSLFEAVDFSFFLCVGVRKLQEKIGVDRWLPRDRKQIGKEGNFDHLSVVPPLFLLLFFSPYRFLSENLSNWDDFLVPITNTLCWSSKNFFFKKVFFSLSLLIRLVILLSPRQKSMIHG